MDISIILTEFAKAFKIQKEKKELEEKAAIKNINKRLGDLENKLSNAVKFLANEIKRNLDISESTIE